MSLQLFRMISVGNCGFFGDQATPVEVQNGLIHGKHAFGTAGSDGIVDLMVFVVPYHTADGAVYVHDLKGRDHVAVYVGQHLLRDYGAKNR